MRHNAIRDLLATSCKAAGLFTLVEQVVAKFSGRSLAKIDVCAWSAYPPLEFYFDVVISHPCAPAYLNKAAECHAITAQSAATKKISKYGCELTPWSLETYGAFDPSVLAVLKDLSNLAASRDRNFGYIPRPYFRTWKAQISATLARAFSLSLRVATTPNQNSHDVQVLSFEERLSRSIASGVTPAVLNANALAIPGCDAPVYPPPPL